MTQADLPMPDFHRRGLAFQSASMTLAEYALAIETAFQAGDRRVLFQIHDELAELETDTAKLTTRALDRVNTLLKERT